MAAVIEIAAVAAAALVATVGLGRIEFRARERDFIHYSLEQLRGRTPGVDCTGKGGGR